MYRKVLSLFAFTILAQPIFAIGSNGWEQLKLGMMPGDTAAALGAPLIRTASRGFELWIYDGHAEVVFFSGPVIAWTAPAGSHIANSPSLNSPVAPGTTVVAPAPATRNAAPRGNRGSDGYDQLPVYRFRRRQ